MAQTLPAYAYPRRSYEQAPTRTPDIHVVPGRGRETSDGTLPASAVTLAKVAAVLLLLFALIGIVRIVLASAAVSTAVETEAVAAQIETARSTGKDLEVRESHLSNPVYLKGEATELNMQAAENTQIMTLSKDVVVCDEAGRLSLSASLKSVAQG